jgi:hypothetical protein
MLQDIVHPERLDSDNLTHTERILFNQQVQNADMDDLISSLFGEISRLDRICNKINSLGYFKSEESDSTMKIEKADDVPLDGIFNEFQKQLFSRKQQIELIRKNVLGGLNHAINYLENNI